MEDPEVGGGVVFVLMLVLVLEFLNALVFSSLHRRVHLPISLPFVPVVCP